MQRGVDGVSLSQHLSFLLFWPWRLMFVGFIFVSSAVPPHLLFPHSSKLRRKLISCLFHVISGTVV